MDIFGILLLLLAFALIGFVVYLIVTYIPMPDIFKQVIIVGCAVLCIVYLIAIVFGRADIPAFGVLPRLRGR